MIQSAIDIRHWGRAWESFLAIRFWRVRMSFFTLFFAYDHDNLSADPATHHFLCSSLLELEQLCSHSTSLYVSTSPLLGQKHGFILIILDCGIFFAFLESFNVCHARTWYMQCVWTAFAASGDLFAIEGMKVQPLFVAFATQLGLRYSLSSVIHYSASTALYVEKWFPWYFAQPFYHYSTQQFLNYICHDRFHFSGSPHCFLRVVCRGLKVPFMWWSVYARLSKPHPSLNSVNWR